MTINSYEIRICNSCGLRYPLTGGHLHGVRCPACTGQTNVILSRQMIHETEPALSRLPPQCQAGFAVLLDNIRSAWNVGSILRSADGFGFDHAYFCGITPTPENEALTKTSLGAENMVAWSYHKDAIKLVTVLKKEGWKVLALEEETRAVSIREAGNKREKAVVIVGNEVTGVDPELLDLCDTIFRIPMRGKKKSFNVAIAFGIAAYALS